MPGDLGKTKTKLFVKKRGKFCFILFLLLKLYSVILVMYYNCLCRWKNGRGADGQDNITN